MRQPNDAEGFLNNQIIGFLSENKVYLCGFKKNTDGIYQKHCYYCSR